MVKSLKIASILVLILFSSCKTSSSLTLVLLPDTQHYSQDHPDIFKSQTNWIVDNAKEITFVLHQGDITNKNTEEQWEVAAEALSLMDNKVPYTFVAGNHDNGEGGKTKTRNTDLLNRYLPYQKYKKSSSLKGVYEPGKMDNTWHTFRAGGYNWSIFSLEFGPRDSVLQWASEIIQTHPKHKVIINTHAYMYSDDTRMGEGKGHKWLPQNYGIGKNANPGSVNDAEQMWDKLVKKHANILFVFSGHVLNDGTGYLVSEGDHGNKVYQMLANYQGGVKGSVNGGNGFLRKITMDTKKGTISVKSYSPYINEYKTGVNQQFVIEGVDF